MLAPIVGKDFEQKFFLGFVLGVLEGLINRGSFRFSIFTPYSVQCNDQPAAAGAAMRASPPGGSCRGATWRPELVPCLPPSCHLHSCHGHINTPTELDSCSVQWSSATTGIRIASYFSHANVFCQTYSHSIHFGAETSHSLSTLQQYILVSL